MNPKERITKLVGIIMVVVAVGFDAVQFGTGIFTVMAAAISSLVAWIPFIGQVVGSAIMFLAVIFQGILAWMIIGIGYLTMTGWFLLSGVSFMSGNYATRRLSMLVIALVIDFMPFINVLPGLSVWVIMQVYLTRREDAENAKKSAPTLNYRRMKRQYTEAET